MRNAHIEKWEQEEKQQDECWVLSVEGGAQYFALLSDVEDAKHLLRSPTVEQQTRREHKNLGLDNTDNDW